MKKLLCIFFLLLSVVSFSQTYDWYNGKKIIKGKVIVKFTSNNTLKSAQNDAILQTDDRQKLQLYLTSIGASELRQSFTQTRPKTCAKCVDISTIYNFTYTLDVPMEKVLSNLNKLDCVVYAEPAYVGELLSIPNDTEYANGNLWHLNTCKVLDAWDIEEGDSTVVVAIVDGGIDVIHKDLINKIAYNVSDPINGLDDDGDGYVDNYRGWDFADSDNNPSSASTEHGTYVAGIASAEVNNEFGTAGVGGKCKFLPIKVCPNTSADVVGGYEGIIYAANQGCKVINCSWGDEVGSQFGQDIIDYATYNCDALVVASAGNSANSNLLYPASYTTVLSVGGTVAGDYIWYNKVGSGSQYNHFIDICAPAKGFYSVANNDKVIAMSGGGTSFAAPIVSGAAAIVRSKFPEYTALQTAELLSVSADDLYEINSEEMYRDKLGHGRLNLYNALTNNVLPSVRIVDVSVENHSNHTHIYSGDTIDLKVTFKNYLHDVENVLISAICDLSVVSVISSDVVFESMKSGEEKTATFSFKVAMTLPNDIATNFKFTYSGAHKYSSYEYYPISLNPNYYDFTFGNISSTVTRDGSLAVYSINAKQNGFRYKNNSNCIYQAGLVLAENQNTIYSRSYKNNGFVANQPATIVESDSCDLEIYSDFYAPNIQIKQFLRMFEDVDATIYEYYLENQRDSVLYDLKFGAFIDWDILTSSYNKTWFVDSLQLSVAQSVDPRSYYVGWLSLDYNPVGVYAFEVANDVIYYNDDFNNNELWYALNNSKTSAGMSTITGKEIACFNYCSIDSIAPADSALVRFALIAADTKEELYNLAYNLKQKYNPNPIDTTQDAIASSLNEYVKISKVGDEYAVLYEKSSTPIEITICAADGKIVQSVKIESESQNGIFYIQKHKSTFAQFVIVCRENEKQTFSLY